MIREKEKRMSETKHTPGPWKYVDTEDRMSLKGLVAVLGGTHYVCADGTSDPVVRAIEDAPNARLIAAAPELLAAARWVANVIGGLGKAGGPPGPDEPDAAADALQAAIAKATR